MQNINKEAKKDAAEYMAAQMSYGEGAGTRRKLIETAVAYKTERITGYGEAFNTFMHTEDPLKHIKNAKRSRLAKDTAAVTGRNIRAVARGDRHGMSTPVILVIVGGAILHQTGYDKKVWAYSKRKTNDVRVWLKNKL